MRPAILTTTDHRRELRPAKGFVQSLARLKNATSDYSTGCWSPASPGLNPMWHTSCSYRDQSLGRFAARRAKGGVRRYFLGGFRFDNREPVARDGRRGNNCCHFGSRLPRKASLRSSLIDLQRPSGPSSTGRFSAAMVNSSEPDRHQCRLRAGRINRLGPTSMANANDCLVKAATGETPRNAAAPADGCAWSAVFESTRRPQILAVQAGFVSLPRSIASSRVAGPHACRIGLCGNRRIEYDSYPRPEASTADYDSVSIDLALSYVLNSEVAGNVGRAAPLRATRLGARPHPRG